MIESTKYDPPLQVKELGLIKLDRKHLDTLLKLNTHGQLDPEIEEYTRLMDEPIVYVVTV